jgi:hypothetical protein
MKTIYVTFGHDGPGGDVPSAAKVCPLIRKCKEGDEVWFYRYRAEWDALGLEDTDDVRYVAV